MGGARPLCAAAFLVGALLWTAGAAAQDDLTLSTACEAGFRRFIEMAESGRLGDDVTDANVGVAGNRVRVELVRSGAPMAILQLTPKRSPQTISRYFEVVPGDGASATDAERVGRALDDVFGEDPFQIRGLEGSPAGDAMPSLVAAWASGGCRGVLRVFERRMAVLASRSYTIAVIVALAVASLASLALLWGSVPPHPTAESTRW
jgi:hypothetical protein